MKKQDCSLVAYFKLKSHRVFLLFAQLSMRNGRCLLWLTMTFFIWDYFLAPFLKNCSLQFKKVLTKHLTI